MLLCVFSLDQRTSFMQTLWVTVWLSPFYHLRIDVSDVSNLSKLALLLEAKAMIQTCCLVIISNYIFIILTINFSLENELLCLVTQSCPTRWDPMDCNPPGSYVHGDSPGKNSGVGCHALLPTRDWTQVSCIEGRFFTIWATREAQEYWSG